MIDHTDPAAGDVIYHGVDTDVGRIILVEDEAGERIGLVRHIKFHSPDGLSWGFHGSGPGDCARSLLVAALGPAARCSSCGGGGCSACEQGYNVPRHLYMAFKVEFVAGWEDGWQMRRSEILAWIAAQGSPTTCPGR